MSCSFWNMRRRARAQALQKEQEKATEDKMSKKPKPTGTAVKKNDKAAGGKS